MLVIHGSKDYRLPETDGIGAFHALQECVAYPHYSHDQFTLIYCKLIRRRGVPSRLVIFPDENHWVLNQKNR